MGVKLQLFVYSPVCANIVFRWTGPVSGENDMQPVGESRLHMESRKQ